jgi:hypothetical protein
MRGSHVAVVISAAIAFLTTLSSIPDGQPIGRRLWIGATLAALTNIGGVFTRKAKFGKPNPAIPQRRRDD